LALLGRVVKYVQSVSVNISGTFTPTTNHQERIEKCTMGLTSMLNLTIILSIVGELVPKSGTHQYPVIGLNIYS
jgi:hypothetical protein